MDSSRPDLLAFLRRPEILGPRALLLIAAVLFLAMSSGCRKLPAEAGTSPGEESRKADPGGISRVAAGDSGSDAEEPVLRAEKIRRQVHENLGAPGGSLKGLTDPDPLVRGSCLLSLLQAEPEKVAQCLADQQGVLKTPEGKFLMMETALRLSRPEKEAAAAWGCRMVLDEQDPLLRSRAAALCLEAGSPDGALLLRIVTDANWAVRARAAGTMARRQDSDPVWQPVLDQLARDPHPTVRQAAARAGHKKDS